MGPKVNYRAEYTKLTWSALKVDRLRQRNQDTETTAGRPKSHNATEHRDVARSSGNMWNVETGWEANIHFYF